MFISCAWLTLITGFPEPASKPFSLSMSWWSFMVPPWITKNHLGTRIVYTLLRLRLSVRGLKLIRFCVFVGCFCVQQSTLSKVMCVSPHCCKGWPLYHTFVGNNPLVLRVSSFWDNVSASNLPRFCGVDMISFNLYPLLILCCYCLFIQSGVYSYYFSSPFAALL